MAPSRPALGTVFTLEDLPYALRVVAFDQSTVMYDTRWGPEAPWAMAKLAGTFCYGRLDRAYFETHARCVGMDPLSDDELEVHRPALPFAAAQSPILSWYEPWAGIDTLAQSQSVAIPVGSIYLWPFGPRDTDKPAVLLHADNGESFTVEELLRKAKAVQDPHVGNVRLTEGVGIYRSGIKKRMPSYYIWGVRSRAEAPAVNLAHAAVRIAREA